jgi:hypothetical protein
LGAIMLLAVVPLLRYSAAKVAARSRARVL